MHRLRYYRLYPIPGIMLREFGFMCWMLFWSGITTAQSSGLSIDFFTSEHGLPHKHVYDITEDDQGYLWIATRNGLARYDGYRFDDFTFTITEGNQLKGHIIYAVEKDRQGKIWVGYDGGLAVLDPLNGLARHQSLTGYHGTDKSVLCISMDRHGRILLSMSDAVVLCYDEEFRLQFSYTFPIDESVLNLEFPLVLEDTDGTYWISSHVYGVEHISANGAFIEHFYTPESPVETTHIKTLTAVNGMMYSFSLGRRSEERKAYEPIPYAKRDKNIFRSYTRPSVMPDKKGNTWIVQGDSITLKGPSVERPVTFSLPYMEEYMQDHALLNVCIGSDNTLWTASRKGIFKINYKPNPFKNYLSRDGLGVTEYGISIRGMAEDENGFIWIGSYSYTVGPDRKICNLNRLNPLTNDTEPIFLIQRDTSNLRAQYAPAYKLLRYRSRFWASTGHTFLYSFDPDSLSIDPIKIPDTLTGTVTGIFATNDSTIFFSTVSASGILTVSSGGDAHFKGLYHQPSGRILDGVNNFFDAGNSLIWAASNNGLYLLNGQGTILKTYAKETPSNIKLPALDINWVYPQSKQRIWLGSRQGLILLDTLHAVTRLYTIDDGLPNNNVMSILPDEFGFLWLSTDRGLCRFHPEENSFISYDIEDGLPHNEFNRMAALKSSNGRLYFGSLNGVTAFYPREVVSSLDDLRPSLTYYNYYNGALDTVLTMAANLASPQALEFSHLDRLFHFHFMLPSYRQPDKNRFLYFLEGWDEEWQTTTGTNIIQYSYLTPGKYLLRVKGAAAGYSWGQLEYTLEIIIRQAWYKTWWSISLAALTIMTIFYGLYRYRVNALMRVQQVRNKISADLHDELGSVLTQISLQSDMVSRDIYTEAEKQKELQNIRETSRAAILTMSDIVWSVNAGHDKTSSLIDRMKDHADLMLQPLDLVPTFTVEGIPDQKNVDTQLRQELFLIFKEAIHNIVKHSRPTYVNIQLMNHDGVFDMRIQNDINTVGPVTVLGGNGLKNMRRRAETINATLDVVSGDDTFEIRLCRKAF